MIIKDEDSLICDLAETYHIYDYTRLPLKTIATLAAGLRDNARIKMKLNGEKVTMDALLSAMIVDRLSVLVWLNSEDGTQGVNRPELIAPKLSGVKKQSNVLTFESAEEFTELRERIIRGEV